MLFSNNRCEAVRFAILATAWLLVTVRCYAERGIAMAIGKWSVRSQYVRCFVIN